MASSGAPQPDLGQGFCESCDHHAMGQTAPPNSNVAPAHFLQGLSVSVDFAWKESALTRANLCAVAAAPHLPVTVVARLMGHEIEGQTFGNYSDGLALDGLKEAINYVDWAK